METGENTETKQAYVEAREKIDHMRWNKKEASLVADFLSGKEVKIDKQANREKLWLQTKEITDFEDEECVYFLEEAEHYFSTIKENYPPADKSKKEAIKPTQEEYIFYTQKSAKTLLDIAARALRKFNIWDTEEHRRISSLAISQPEEKKVYGQAELLDQEISEKGFYHPSEGGPQIISRISVPRFESTKRTAEKRTRRSLAHEIAHNLRALTNKDFWEGFEKDANKIGLRSPEKEAEIENIGGFYVGSDKQGSEAIGELFSETVDYEASYQREATIADIIPFVSRRFQQSIERFTKKVKKYESGESETLKASYFPARFALIHHLIQLKEMGYGNIKAKDLVALGTYGYVSLEKVPALIELGVLSQEKYQKMKNVINTLSRWLTSSSEEGFNL